MTNPPDPMPRLHAVYERGGVAMWCDTGLGRPDSIAPASGPAAVAKGGAPAEVQAVLARGRQGVKAEVLAPVSGSIRRARVPATWLDPASAVDCAEVTRRRGGEWRGASLVALEALSEAVAAFVGTGHVVPHVDGDRATWRLLASPEVVAWRSGLGDRLSGLTAGERGLDGLLDALTDTHARRAIAASAEGRIRRSKLGIALSAGGPAPLGDGDLPRAVADFAAAVAAHGVDVTLRVLEPDAGDEWRLEVLVRLGDQALAPLRDLPDPDAAAEAVDGVLERAGRFWPPLAAAEREGRGELLVGPEDIVDLVDRGVELIRPAGVEVLIPKAWMRSKRADTTVRAVVTEGVPTVDSGSRVDLESLGTVRWELLLGGEVVDEADLARLRDDYSELVSIRGRWVRADADALRRALRFLEERDGERGTARDFVTALASEEAEGLSVQAPDVWPGPKIQTSVETPDWFAATLRPYQRRGVEWLHGLTRSGTGGVLADDMGLGKTVQVLALEAIEHAHRRAAGGIPTLVVAPLSLLATWRAEAARFAPRLRVHTHHGPGRLDGSAALAEFAAADLVLTSYGTAARDAGLLAGARWHRLVADEAQTVKNPDTQLSKALREIGAPQAIALTGTPVENRLDELRAIFDFVNPGLLGSASSFRSRFAVPIESRGDSAAASRLRALCAPFVLRRVKSDPAVAADLPDKIHLRVASPLTREQAALYRAVVDDMLEAVKGADGVSRKGAIFAGLTALKQVCNHPAHYLADGSLLLRGGRHRSGKLEAVEEILGDIRDAGESALLFTQYRAFGDMIRPWLARLSGRDVPYLHGGVSASGRAALVSEFQADSGPSLFLCSLKAGGTGLTLTRSNNVLHLDRWWNPAVEAQATDRVHRIGQQRAVTVRTFVAPGTVEERIEELLESKSDLADLTVGGLAELDDSALAEVLRLREGEVDDG